MRIDIYLTFIFDNRQCLSRIANRSQYNLAGTALKPLLGADVANDNAIPAWGGDQNPHESVGNSDRQAVFFQA